MKQMKKILAIALIVMSVMAITVSAMAIDEEGYRDYLGGPGSSQNLRQSSTYKLAVKNLQYMLLYVGFNPGPCDGIFGSRTLQAVRSFQSTYGLAVDGIVGADTKRVLWMAMGYQPTPECVPID